MQIAFILAELIVPENVEYLQISDSFRALSLKIKQKISEVGFYGNSNNSPCFYELMNYLSEGGIRLLHSFCNKFLKKIEIILC